MATMMLTPMNYPTMANLNQLAAAAAAAQSPTAAFEGVPIYLVPNGGAGGAGQSLAALGMMPKVLHDIKANLAAANNQLPKVDTSKHFHVFVGDLSPEIDNKGLKDAFSPFGDVSDAKVIRDTSTFKSKGYGFVSFPNKEEAERAIEGMNGRWIGRRAVRTNWAARKPPAPQPKNLTVEEIYNQTGPTNCTVYVGGTNANTTDTQLKETFGRFGNVAETRVFKQQGYCFVRFETKEAATAAIASMNGQDLGGCSIKCSWGKEEGGKMVRSNSITNLTQLQLGAAASAAAAANYPLLYYNIYNNQTSALLQQWQNAVQQQQMQAPGTPLLNLNSLSNLNAFAFPLH